MPNVLLTVQDIADQAALRLRENEVMSRLVSRDYDEKIADKGDTVQIRVPNVFDAKDFDTTGTIVAQSIVEGKRLLTLNKIKDVSVTLSSKEKTLNINDYTEQVINPAIEALAKKVDQDLMGLYKYVPYHTGTAGTTPSTLDAFAQANKILNANKCPVNTDKAGVWDEEADAKFCTLDALVNAEKSGSTETLKMGSIGKVFRIQNYMDQNVVTHVAGGYTSLADVKAVVTAANNGETINKIPYSQMVLTSSAGTATTALKAGDLIVVGTRQFTVLEDTENAVAGVVTAKVYPALSANLSSTDAVFPDRVSRGHTANLVFHPRAFVFANRPLSTDLGGVECAVASIDGLSVRVIRGFDQDTKEEKISFDILYGILPLQPELAVRVLG